MFTFQFQWKILRMITKVRKMYEKYSPEQHQENRVRQRRRECTNSFALAFKGKTKVKEKDFLSFLCSSLLFFRV